MPVYIIYDYPNAEMEKIWGNVSSVTRGIYEYPNFTCFENIWVMQHYCNLSYFFYVQLL